MQTIIKLYRVGCRHEHERLLREGYIHELYLALCNTKKYNHFIALSPASMFRHYLTIFSHLSNFNHGDAALGHSAEYVHPFATSHGNAQTRGDQAEYVGCERQFDDSCVQY